MARNYAALPHEYLEEMDILSDAEFGRLCRALLQYSMTGKEVRLEGAEKVLLKRVFLQERRFQKSYEEQAEAKRSAGKKGAAKRWQTVADDGTAMAEDSKHGDTETKTETDPLPSDDGRGKGAARPPKRPHFVPPTLEEVTAYVQERGSRVDPQGFLDFYAAKGWLVGKTPMKDWKAACRNAENWERWEKPQGKTGKQTASDYSAKAAADRLKRDMEELERLAGGGEQA